MAHTSRLIFKFKGFLAFIMFLAGTSFQLLGCKSKSSDLEQELNSNSQAAPELSQFSGVAQGQIQDVDSKGVSFGYALDPYNKSESMRVIFYVDGPVGQGIYAGEILANTKSVGTYQGHYFFYSLPAQFVDGKSHTLYAYGHQAQAATLLSSSPKSYVSFSPKAEALFDQTIKSFVTTSCNRCHSWNYSALLYGPLLSPRPGSGGSALNNSLINTLGSGNHQGNAFCSSKSDNFCMALQNWWRAEFQ